MQMNLGEWLGAASLGVAVIAIPVAVFATRRWGNRRRRLLFVSEATPLIPSASVVSDSKLKVTYGGFEVPNPQLLTIELRNIGPVDVASSHFDGGAAVQVTLNCDLYGVVSSSHPKSTVVSAIGSSGEVSLNPMLLKRGDAWLVEVIVSGEPDVQVSLPLIDTDLVERADLEVPGQVAQAILKAAVAAMPLFARQSQAVADAVSTAVSSRRSKRG